MCIRDRWQHLKDPAFRSQLLAEQGEPTGSDLQLIADLMETAFSMQYEMLPGFNYEPTAEQSIEQRAQATGATAAEYAYDFMMRDEGAGMIYFPLLNYANGNLDFLEKALDSDDCVNSLSDGGAHCGTICDAAATTFMLQHWVRDRGGSACRWSAPSSASAVTLLGFTASRTGACSHRACSLIST